MPAIPAGPRQPMPTAPKSPPTRPLMIGVALVLALFLCGAWIAARSYTDLHAMLGHELELRYVTGQLLALQAERAKAAQLAVETGDPSWEQRYRALQPPFDAALQRAVAAAPSVSSIASPTWAASAALAATEAAAFEKLRLGQRSEARALLTGADYRRRESAYVDGLNRMSAAMLAQAQQRLSLERLWMAAAALLGLALLGALGAAWVWISGLVQRYLAAVQAADAELAENNRQLESRVQARTAQLSTVNQQLREEMERRSKMEAELRQSQKLEAIGRLAAGVAHEINTPVQFVSDHCHFLRQGVTDTLSLVGQYRDALDAVIAGELSAAQAGVRVAAARQSGDADFLADNLPQAADHALEGLRRVTQIVRSMQEYAHPGKQQAVLTDLNHAIENAVTIAQNQTKTVAEVSTRFGDIPLVPCFPGEINQVILNLLVNAAHAIEAAHHGDGERGHITVSTRQQDNDVILTIDDDGCGIPEAIRDKIFDPFFTTKDVGKGTGQGLAIVRRIIVEQHHGELTVDSTVGHGSRFQIRLPLTPATERAA